MKLNTLNIEGSKTGTIDISDKIIALKIVVILTNSWEDLVFWFYLCFYTYKIFSLYIGNSYIK